MSSRIALFAVIATLALRGTASTPPPQPRVGVVDSLPSPTGRGAAQPNLAVGPDGRVHLSWLEPGDSGTSALRFAVLSGEGTSWSAPRTIVARNDLIVNWADFPSLIVLDGGAMAAHWLQRGGRGAYAYGVRLSQSRDGGRSWSAAVTAHRDSSPTEHGFVALWRESGSSVGAAWLDGRKMAPGSAGPREMALMSTSLGASGALGAESTLDERVCDCCQNAAAMTSEGPIVAYRDRTADEIRDVYVARRVGGRWLPGRPVHRDGWRINACPVNGPAVAARGQRVAVAWFAAPGDSARVQLALSTDAGATFGAPIRVDNGAPAGRVDVALLADGAALVTWIERAGGDTASVRVRRISPAGQAGTPVVVAASSAARASGFPRVVLSGEHAYFAWTVPGRPTSVRVGRARVTNLR